MMQRVISEVQRGRALFGVGFTSVIIGYSATGVGPVAVNDVLSELNWNTVPFWNEVSWESASQETEELPVVGHKSGYPAVDAVAAILQKQHPKFSRIKARRLAHDILGLCQRYGFTPGFILGLIHVESAFDPKIESFAGAVGLMQVKPSTAKPVAEKLNLPWKGKKTLENPHHNLQIGFEYLHQLRKRLPLRKQYVTAYNWGPTRIQRFVEKRRKLPLDYYKKVIRFGKRYAHLDQRPALQ